MYPSALRGEFPLPASPARSPARPRAAGRWPLVATARQQRDDRTTVKDNFFSTQERLRRPGVGGHMRRWDEPPARHKRYDLPPINALQDADEGPRSRDTFKNNGAFEIRPATIHQGTAVRHGAR